MSRTCVVFDLDDTLFLERDYVRSGFRAVDAWAREHRGLDGFFEAAWGAFSAGTRGTIFNRALVELGVTGTEELVSELVDVYRTHEPDIDLQLDALLCLQDLKGRVLLGVITDGPAPSQRAKAKALAIYRWVPEPIFTEELGPGLSKPHPFAFELIEKQTGCSRSQCAYVADNPAKDFRAPRELGWVTVRTRRAEGLHAGIDSGADVDCEIEDLSGLADLIDKRTGSELPC